MSKHNKRDGNWKDSKHWLDKLMNVHELQWSLLYPTPWAPGIITLCARSNINVHVCTVYSSQDDNVGERDVHSGAINLNNSMRVHHLVTKTKQTEHAHLMSRVCRTDKH